MENFQKLTAILSSEFDKYVMEHPEIGHQIPRNALIVFQLENNNEYNHWSRDLAEKYREKDQPVFFVHIKGLRPALSRLIEPKVEPMVFI